MSLDSFLAVMPKAELHVHLEGSVQPETLLTLARRNGVPLPADDAQGLRAFYRFTTYAHYLEVHGLIQRCLSTPEDWAFAVHELAREMDRQSIRYAEVTWTPVPALRRGLAYADLLSALEKARAEVRLAYGLEMRWLPGVARDLGLEAAMQTASLAVESRGSAVIGLSLGGPEDYRPPAPFAPAFALARQAGLKSYPHAGELAGPPAVWSSLGALQANRIGHGVRAIEDVELVSHLSRRRITLDVCPTSNIRLGVYRSYGAHPLRQLYDAGVSVTLNSDDPPLLGTDLTHEYHVAAREFGFSVDALCDLSLGAVGASFLGEDDKVRLERDFAAEFERLKRRHL